MVVQHNIPAFNANRQLGINNNALSKSLEKLSSGYAINRAGDNAAGLAISEKMRGQISGLTQASANAQDAISLIQTGEGALQETHSILQRMRELSVQSANGTYQDEVDRENIAKEVDALKSELDRISSSTEFNGMKLLDGSISGVETDGRTIGKIDGVTTGSIDKTYGNISKISVSGAKSTVKTATIVGANTAAGKEVIVSNKEQKQVAIAATQAGFGTTTSTSSGAAGTSVNITFDFGEVTMATSAPAAQVGGADAGSDPTKAMADYIKNMDNTVIKLDNLNIRFTSQKTGDESSYDEATQTLTIGIRDLANKATDTSTNVLTEESMDKALVSLVSEKATDSEILTNSGYSFTTDGQKLQISLKGNITDDQLSNGFHASTYKLEKETGTIDLNEIAAGDVKAGTTFTVDGKTYELTNDASTVKNGNIAVTIGDRTGATAIPAKTVENANGAEITKALFNAIMAQDDYSDSNNNKSGLVVEYDAANAKITVTNEGERVKGASKVTANGSREEITNTLKIDQVVQKGTTIQVGDTSVIFDEDTTAADALTKIETEVKAGLIEKYGASGAGQAFAAAQANDAVKIDPNTKTITFKAVFGERQDVSVTPVENAERQTITLDSNKIQNGSTLSYGGKTYEFVGKEGDKVTTKGNIAVVNNANVAENTYKQILASSKTSGDTTDIKLKGNTLEFATSAKITTSTAIDESKASKNEKLTFQIGANGTEDQRVSLGIDSMSSSTIGITTKDEETGKVTVEKSIADIDVSTREAANDAIAVIDAAINQVSGTRADLGALQNRLEHTISSLDIANENLTAAESRIRDTDMASEMMKFTKNQIMSQASQSMLAQANTLPQGVLSLLQ